MREADIEGYLVRRVNALRGEVRKVQWVGRKNAPDRVVMLPGNLRISLRPLTAWIELKRPGLAATFPNDAHERAQHREHERMRKMGQRVEVIDSFQRVDEVLL